MYLPLKFYTKTFKNAHLSFSGRQKIPAGCKAGPTSPNAQLAENGPKNLEMYLPLKFYTKTFKNTHLSFSGRQKISASWAFGLVGPDLQPAGIFCRPLKLECVFLKVLI